MFLINNVYYKFYYKHNEEDFMTSDIPTKTSDISTTIVLRITTDLCLTGSFSEFGECYLARKALSLKSGSYEVELVGNNVRVQRETGFYEENGAVFIIPVTIKTF